MGAESGVGRSRAGNSLIAYPAMADMIDPAMVRKSEPAYRETQSALTEEVSTGTLPAACQETEIPLRRADTTRSRSVRRGKYA